MIIFAEIFVRLLRTSNMFHFGLGSPNRSSSKVNRGRSPLRHPPSRALYPSFLAVSRIADPAIREKVKQERMPRPIPPRVDPTELEDRSWPSTFLLEKCNPALHTRYVKTTFIPFYVTSALKLALRDANILPKSAGKFANVFFTSRAMENIFDHIWILKLHKGSAILMIKLIIVACEVTR